MLYWAPCVTIDPSGVIVRNIVREHEVTWPAIERVDTKYALQLFTADGHHHRVERSRAGPARCHAGRVARARRGSRESTYAAERSIRPSDIPSSESGLAALYVRRFWEQLRDGGYLDKACRGNRRAHALADRLRS